MRTTPASQTGIYSVLMASSVKNARFSKRGIERQKRMMAPGEVRGSLGGRQPLGP